MARGGFVKRIFNLHHDSRTGKITLLSLQDLQKLLPYLLFSCK